MKKLTWPAWFNSPDGKTSAIFETAEDVPSGWTSGAEKQTTGEKPAAKSTPTPSPTPAAAAKTPAATANSGVGGEGKTAPSGNVELDTAGWPWTAELHASSKSKTKDGLWRMKVGVARPEPAPGYPLDL